MTARDTAAAAGQAASVVLTSAERVIRAAMSSAVTQVIRGTLSPALARRKVANQAAVALGVHLHQADAALAIPLLAESLA